MFQDLYGNATVPTPDDIRGALCNIVWLITCVVSIKYVLVMMATGHFHGEGGTFSLLHSIKESGALRFRPRVWRVFQVLAALAGALIVADGVLTPVVTVTSAVEGIGLSVWRFNGAQGTISLDNGKPGFASNYGTTCTLAAAILVLIFGIQLYGSQKIGVLYGPITVVWLLFIGITGAQSIAAHGGGDAFRAWNPDYLRYFWTRSSFKGTAAWHAYGGVFLAVTGAEALFADLGHFGFPAISLAWFLLVYPMLLLAYTGQAAWLLSLGDLTDAANPALCFSLGAGGAAAPGAGTAPYATYLSFPAAAPGCTAEGFVGLNTGSSGPNGIVSNVFWHVAGRGFGSAQYKAILAIATLASVVGSQALITGVFTILTQASALGLFPFMQVTHTSALYEHQIFVGGANFVLCVVCLIVTGTFQHSSNLTAVYGACVSTAMLVTTLLYTGVIVFALRKPLLLATAVCLPLLFMDTALASANVAKYFTSGPVLLSYPSNTNAILQSQTAIGTMGPVPQNAWVAMIPLIVSVIMFAVMCAHLWGRRKVLLHSAKLSALLFKPVGVPAHVNEQLGAEGRQGPVDVELASVELRSPSALDRNDTIRNTMLHKELCALAAEGGASQLAQRYGALAAALRALADGGLLARPDAVGLFLSSGASFWDTEPVATPDEELLLDLPKAFLTAVLAGRALPALAIVLDVRFLAGTAVAPAGRRTEVRAVGGGVDGHSPLGVYHVVVRYGFAEQPGDEGALVGLLVQLAGEHVGLAGLAHLRCTPGHCRCHEAVAQCSPATFSVARDALARGRLWQRPATALFNTMQANTNGRAAFLHLPRTHVSEQHGTIDLNRLHYRTRAGAPTDGDGSRHSDEEAAAAPAVQPV